MSAFTLPSPADLGAAVLARLDELAGYTDEPGKITRLYLSKSHRRAVTLVESWMRDAGLSVRLDPLATLIGTYPGSDPDTPHLLLGSHIDSVRDAGKYDGTLGVVSAIEIVRRLNAAGKRLPFNLTVLAFGDEEGVRFPSTLTGSAAVAGRFNPKILDEKGEDGITRRMALAEFGCPEGDPAAPWQGQSGLGYLELHIEQGPVLEAENRPVGLVTAIQGVTRGLCRIVGSAGHAGTVPMALRRDALSAAAEMILAVERIGRETEGLVATIGQLRVPGGAVNTIPGAVEFSLDFRSEIDAVRKEAEVRIRQAVEAVAAARKVEANLAYTYEAPASECDPGLRLMMAEAAESVVQKPIRLLPSGAGHDAMSFRGKLPFMMLFVRSKAGISHSPDEFTSEADLGIATATLFRAVLDLAKKHA